MNQRLKTITIAGLRWTLGLVVLFQSFQFAFSPSAIHRFAQTGLPQWIRPALAGSEIIAALLFLIPAASVIGSYLLLLIFAIAIVVHFLHGQFDVGGLIVYGMAAIVCMTHRDIDGTGVGV
jgi:hypothetical protein